MTSKLNTCAPLEGVRVLDLTRAVTGPFCTLLLGDLGARIIKIEEPRTGDETRQWGPPFVEGESAYFLALNRNKESVVLDFKQEGDLAALRRLASESDVVAQNFRPGVAERLGVNYESLRAANEDLIYASISGFGLTGPDCQRPGYDLIVQAMSGMMLASGWEGVPAKACFPVADILAGQFASQAILAALYERERTGKGAHIEVSLLEALLFAMPSQTMGCLLTGTSPAPNTAMIAPYQLLQCQDAALAVAVPNERIWRRFCEALGRPEWTAEERYRTNQRRIQNRDSLIEQIEAVMRLRGSAEWQAILDRHQVPCGRCCQSRRFSGSRRCRPVTM
jgi:crotonobetainyl-CoA:carnitine CoA-transferase CaiB-like acyl-CoA transferase